MSITFTDTFGEAACIDAESNIVIKGVKLIISHIAFR
jgi:hypothetical protein